MKEASECFMHAVACEILARQAQDSSIARALLDVADQWRRLALDADRHKRQTKTSFAHLPPAHEIAREGPA
jgi:hypothetical protein